MGDCAIIALYFQRMESAVMETAKKYGKYCFCISNNILVESGNFSLPHDKVKMTTVSGCDIYYTSIDVYIPHENQDVRFNDAVFSVNGSMYKISTIYFSPEELIQYLTDMLNSLPKAETKHTEKIVP